MAVIRSVVDKRGFPRFMIGNKKFSSLPQACHALYLDEDEKLSFSTSDTFAAYSALSDHGLALKFDQCFASIRSTGMR